MKLLANDLLCLLITFNFSLLIFFAEKNERNFCAYNFSAKNGSVIPYISEMFC